MCGRLSTMSTRWPQLAGQPLGEHAAGEAGADDEVSKPARPGMALRKALSIDELIFSKGRSKVLTDPDRQPALPFGNRYAMPRARRNRLFAASHRAC